MFFSLKTISYIVTIEATRKRLIVFSMRFFLNPILSYTLITLPRKNIAGDFRNMELLGMNTFGVQAGMYQLENVQFEKDSIWQRLFYTLAYKHNIS